MAVSWQFHGTFTYKPYLGTVCQNLLEKLSKKSVLVVVLFFLPNFSFFFGNMSDSCRFHGPFMAVSWRFLPSDVYCFSKQFHGTCMSDSWQIHRGFMPVSFNPKKSKSCQIHVTFMAVSWQFHGTFTYKSYLGTVCQNLLSKKSVLVVDLFFCLISASFLAICQIHVGFMALSWHFLPSDFYHFVLKQNPNQQLNPSQKWPSSLNVRFIANSSRIHGAFMSLSWHFPVSFTSMSDSSRIHVTFMAVSWHFHIQALPGYSLPKSIGKVIQKVGVGCRFVFFA